MFCTKSFNCMNIQSVVSPAGQQSVLTVLWNMSLTLTLNHLCCKSPQNFKPGFELDWHSLEGTLYFFIFHVCSGQTLVTLTKIDVYIYGLERSSFLNTKGFFSRSDLLLVVLDGQFEAAEVHAFLQQTSLVHVIFAGGMIQNNLQLSWVSSLCQQVLGEHLTLLRQLLVIIPGVKKSDWSRPDESDLFSSDPDCTADEDLW